MPSNSLVIVVGLTGVGKTTVLERAMDLADIPVERLSYGTILLERAQALNLVENRDEITDLPPTEYSELQNEVAHFIGDTAREADDTKTFVLDTHATLDTPYGFRPGLPQDDIRAMDPDQLVFISASPEEIHDRRASDTTRDRTIVPPEDLAEHQDIALSMATASAVASQAPLATIQNSDGGAKQAAIELTPLLERNQ